MWRIGKQYGYKECVNTTLKCSDKKKQYTFTFIFISKTGYKQGNTNSPQEGGWTRGENVSTSTVVGGRKYARYRK